MLTRDWTHDHDSEVVSVGLHNDDISVRFTWRRGSINESFLTIFTDGNLIRPFIIRDDFASLTEDTILSVKYAPATPIKPVAMSKRLGPDDDSFIQVEITFP